MPFSSSDVDRLTRATVRDDRGDKVGTVGQVYVDADGAPVWASVRTGFFGTSESFVPLDAAGLADDGLRVPYGRDVVKGAPRVDADGELDERETEALYDYYDGHRVAARERDHDGSADADADAGADRGDTARTAAAGSSASDDAVGPDAAALAVAAGAAAPGTRNDPGEQDGFVTRSEERLVASTRTVEAGRARLRKHVVTERQVVTVPVTHEEAVLVREPIPAAEASVGLVASDLSEEEHVVVLHGEEVVTSTRVVPVERVRLGVEQVVEQRQVSGEVRREQVDLIEPDRQASETTTRTAAEEGAR